jgi:hypothetical protein
LIHPRILLQVVDQEEVVELFEGVQMIVEVQLVEVVKMEEDVQKEVVVQMEEDVQMEVAVQMEVVDLMEVEAQIVEAVKTEVVVQMEEDVQKEVVVQMEVDVQMEVVVLKEEQESLIHQRLKVLYSSSLLYFYKLLGCLLYHAIYIIHNHFPIVHRLNASSSILYKHNDHLQDLEICFHSEEVQVEILEVR